jgi:nucleotide-binding universal stress UspA family protein
MIALPRKILLATDLGARSDRAMDRATILMNEFGAELLVLHVMEAADDVGPSPRASIWRPFEPTGPNPRLMEIAARQLHADLRDAGERVTICIEHGDPGDVIPQAAREHGSDLIVTGVARSESLGRFTLGKTVDRVLRDVGISVLVVTDRARSPYRNIVVAVDLSVASREALETAVALFPEQRITVFHAYDVPFLSFMSDSTAIQGTSREAALVDVEAFVQVADVSDDSRKRLEVVVGHGEPEPLLRQLAHDRAIELVVLGVHGRGRVLNAIMGSVARRIVAGLPCDALLVRGGAGT